MDSNEREVEVAKAASTALMLGSQGAIEPRAIHTEGDRPSVEVVHDGERYRLVVVPVGEGETLLDRFHAAGWRIGDDGDPYRPEEVPAP